MDVLEDLHPLEALGELRQMVLPTPMGPSTPGGGSGALCTMGGRVVEGVLSIARAGEAPPIARVGARQRLLGVRAAMW